MNKRREIIIETHTITLRQPDALVLAWCARCEAQVRLLTVEEAAAASGQRALTLYRQVEAGALHYLEMPDGALRLCLASLLKLADTTPGLGPATEPAKEHEQP